MMVDDDSDTDQIHGVWTHIGSVQARVCILRCAEEVFKSETFGMLMLSFIRKIRLFIFSLIPK